ncbi:hypothetical protein [Nocardiopsis algeriensis]|uniref:Uncharacterized protein n=1 Tax=Nocardiopsis algeriensis TaxID=1478215 RepID=A0A841IM04_9ACTN|nr:hypothetical protein [Nocardiopsis algeriensis]MBB6119683.1 hypothetical protein [Nocardiopsis algeriensis]
MINFDSALFWVVFFGLPIAAIVAIVLLARYQSSGVQEDGRDDAPDDSSTS